MIEFHCQFCTKLIRTADENAGKHGNCPACHQKVYIPTPEDQIEPLKLAPIDAASEAEQRRLDAEAKAVARQLLHEREVPAGAARPSAAAAPDMETVVVQYVLLMSQGALEKAQALAADIRRNMKAAEPVIQRLSMDDIPPPQLAKVPRPVMIGFLRQLQHK